MPILLFLLFLPSTSGKSQLPAWGGLPRAHLLPREVRRGGGPQGGEAGLEEARCGLPRTPLPHRAPQEASQGQRWRQHRPRRPACLRAAPLPRPLRAASQGHRCPGLPRDPRRAASPRSPLRGNRHPHRAAPTRSPPRTPRYSRPRASAGEGDGKGRAGREPRQPGRRRAEPAGSPRIVRPRNRARSLLPGSPGLSPSPSPGSPALRRPLAGSAPRRRQGLLRPSPVPAAAAVPGPAVLRSALLFTFTCLLATLHPCGWGPWRTSSGPPAPGCLPAFLGKAPSCFWLPRQPLPLSAGENTRLSQPRKKISPKRFRRMKVRREAQGNAGSCSGEQTGAPLREAGAGKLLPAPGRITSPTCKPAPTSPGTLLSEALGNF